MSVSLPLFEGGLKTAQLSKAKALYNQREADERSIENDVFVSLEENWKALGDIFENMEVQRTLLKAREARAEIAERQYLSGFISFDNWIIIQDDLVKAKKSYLEAQVDALLAEAKKSSFN